MRFSMRCVGISTVLICFVASANYAHSQRVRDPEADAAYKAGLEQLAQENYEEAMGAFSKAAQLDELDVEALIGRGDALRGLEDYANAQQSYMAALLLDDQLARAHYGQGVCYREMGDVNSAFASFNDAVDLDRNDPEIAADLGELLVTSTEDTAGAMRYLDKAIELDPANAVAYRNRARGHAVMGEPEDAIADLMKSVEIDPTAFETYSTLAQVYLGEEDYEESIDAFTKAIEAYKPEKSSDLELFVSGYLERARTRLLLAVLDDTPESVREQLYEAVLADAEEVLAEYPERMPEAGYAYHRRGQALRYQKKYGEAIQAFTEAIQLVPGGRSGPYIAEALLKRGICQHYQDQDSLARPDFEQSAAINFTDPLPHLWLGYSYAQDEQYRRAIQSYGDAIAKSPDFSLAFVNRGLAYMQLGEFNKAVDNFNEAIRHEPMVAEHYYKRGIAHRELDEFQKALDSFDHATRYDNNHIKAHRGAVAALRSLGRDTLADQQEALIQELEQQEPSS